MIELQADLGLKLDATLDDIRQYVKWRAYRERTLERYLPRPFGFLVPAEPLFGTVQVAVAMDIGGPSEGRIWQVDRFNVDTAPMGATRPEGVTILLAVAPGERQGETINLRPDSMFWRGTQTEYSTVGYPAHRAWGSREFVVQALEHLFIIAVQPHPETLHPHEEHQVAGRVAISDFPYHESDMRVEAGF